MLLIICWGERSEDYHTEDLYRACGADLTVEDDPLRKSIDSLVNDRVAIQNVTVTFGEDQSQTIEDAETANITVTYINPAVIDEEMTVDVILNTGDKEIVLGNTPLYTESVSSPSAKSEKKWTVSRFDNEWYLLNNQITSFVVTDHDADASTYNGYMRMACWNNASDVAGDPETDRDMYIREKIGNSELKIVFLNVEVDYSDSEAVKYTPLNFYTSYDNDMTSGANALSELEGKYLELLGGAGSTMNSIGTVYAETNPDDPDTPILNITTTQIKDLTPNYNFGDFYGNKYEFVDKVLENSPNPEDMEKSLEGFKEPEQEDYYSFETSQGYAAQIREQAAEEAAEEESEQEDATKSSETAPVKGNTASEEIAETLGEDESEQTVTEENTADSDAEAVFS